ENAETIAVQMAGLQLVAVPRYRQHTHAVAVQSRQVRLGARRDRHHLARHGATVLHARGADLAHRYIEALRHLPSEELGAHIALLDPEIEKVADTAGCVGRNFLDLEVLQFDLDASADPGQVGGQQRRRCERIEGHGCSDASSCTRYAFLALMSRYASASSAARLGVG